MQIEGIILILGIVIAILLTGAGLAPSLKARSAWKKFANQTGLTYKHSWLPDVTHLSGMYQGRQVELVHPQTQ